MGKFAKVSGESMVRNSAGVNELEFYEEEFILDDSVESKEKARQIIKKGLITARLQGKVKGFRRVRTCQIEEFKDTETKSENSDLDKLLIEAVELDCLPLNIDNYRRPDYKAKALANAIAEAKARKARVKTKDTVQDLGYID